ncbi:UbiA family prenyltransferase, partial [Phenylobacterium sp.]|uniref:UbiA family prenyltransferase n=1 Tax=Phenylobacterium sp. TaxID=1871053 RepID=UPI002ED8A8EC
AGYAPEASHLSVAALLLYAGGVAWTLGYDTIYAIQDLEDDALAGVKSSARRLGDAAPRAVGAFYLLSLTAALSASVSARLGLGFGLLFIAYALHLGLQAIRVRVDDPGLALRLFKSNTWAGLILFLAITAGAWRIG